MMKMLQSFPLNKEVLLSKLRSTGIYLLVPVINFAVSFFTSPIFAKYLTVEEFGYYGFYLTLANFFLIFFNLSFQTYYMSMYYREDGARRKNLLVSLILFLLLWDLVFFPVAYFGILMYFKYSGSVIPFFPFALLAFISVAFSVSTAFTQINFRMGQKPFKFLLWVSGYRVLTILVSLYFVVVPQWGLFGRMLGAAIVEFIFFATSLSFILRRQQLKIDRSILKHTFKKILPLLPASFLFWPILSYDNIVIERMHEDAQLGLYNIGKGIANYLYVALFPFYQTFEPDIYKHTVQNNIPALKKITAFLFIVIGLSILSFWILSPYLIDYLTAGKYKSAARYSNILAITYSLLIVFSILDAIIIAWQETKVNLKINLVAAISSITLYSLAGKYFKQEGVAIATIFVQVVIIILMLIFISRRFQQQTLLKQQEQLVNV